MIDISKATYTDRWDNGRVTEIYFDLPPEMAEELSQGQFQREYEKALAQLNSYNASELIPHMELQVSCPYGGMFECLGSVGLGIGIKNIREGSTEVLDVVDLIPDRDFLVEDAVALWKDGLLKDGERDLDLE